MRYYGVIGNRDYIKIDRIKRPFWEFLDKQPHGYLTSLIYMRSDLPNTHMIFDCGAWSYKDKDVPVFGKNILTPGFALFEKYAKIAKDGDFVIAPDHMLIDGVDIDARRKINIEYARDFIKLHNGYNFKTIPMATIHGMDLNERIEHGKKLYDLGYKYLAIGGLAARAAQKSLVVDMVLKIREEFPDVWLHVLGLSSPPYAAIWHHNKIDSFDGSSHFKQAFTGGAFFAVENGKLKKWQAARPGEDITAPGCKCLACSKLKEQGVDTRRYGSNEHNMGRAAHNMNMLMQAQQIAITGTTVLVSCVGEKLDHKAKAKDIYQSAWFKKARSWAESNATRWYILSAKHGLLNPEQEIDPYECTLNTMSISERKKWGHITTEEIKKNVPNGKIIVLAGKKYRDVINFDGYDVSVPMEGLGIGQQLSWLSNDGIKEQELPGV